MKNVNSGWWRAFLIGAIAGGMIYDFGKWSITQNNYEYGKRMYESGPTGNRGAW